MTAVDVYNQKSTQQQQNRLRELRAAPAAVYLHGRRHKPHNSSSL
jgi:hypothetical protein